LVIRTLITTADERTWPKDKNEPVLFLGEWCKRFSRRHIWKDMDYKTAVYHWNDRDKLLSDYKYIQNFYKEFLIDLSRELNKKHKVSHSVRYWKVLVGPWLGYFIQILFDRWFMLKFVLSEYELSNCYYIERKLKPVLPNDMKDFESLLSEDYWNEAIYTELLLEIFSNKIKLTPVNVEKNIKIDSQKSINRFFNKGKLKKKIVYSVLGVYNKIFSKQTDYFILSSYLPFLSELKLQIHLKQFPKIWHSKRVCTANPSHPDRKEWGMEFNSDIAHEGLFGSIITRMILRHIPISYFEGYKVLVKDTREVDWPANPQAIFTSNSYSSDDFFKCWAAEKIEKDSDLIIGQHGGNFGMSLFSFHEEHQIDISDKWLSWGWEDDLQAKIVSLGNIKMIGKGVKNNSNGGVLLVGMALPRYSYHLYNCPIAGQWLNYFNDQILFVKTLPKKIQNSLTVRLHAEDYGWDQKERWNHEYPNIEVDNGVSSMNSLIRDNRLYISTYNATTYLESLSLNIPTIIFWNCSHWELRAEAIPYFDLLEAVGIFHKTPEGAAQKVTEIWDDVELWWKSDSVQKAKSIFSEKYTRKIHNATKEIQDIFIK
jgi:putative transferase (TIGR04331 family)